MISLDILVASLHERAEQRSALLSELHRQIAAVNGLDAFFIVDTDGGEMSIGAKRNLLLSRSEADFVAFVDDDDEVSELYLQRISDALAASPDVDCIGIRGVMTTNGMNPKPFIHSLKFNHYHERDGVLLRPPNHLNPIRRDLALKVGFPDVRVGEDMRFASRMAIEGHLKTEAFIETPIYFYRFDTHKTATQAGIPVVGE